MNFWIPSQTLKHFSRAAYYYYYMFLVLCILYCCSISGRCCHSRIKCKVLEVNNHLITSFLLEAKVWRQKKRRSAAQRQTSKQLHSDPRWCGRGLLNSPFKSPVHPPCFTLAFHLPTWTRPLWWPGLRVHRTNMHIVLWMLIYYKMCVCS